MRATRSHRPTKVKLSSKSVLNEDISIEHLKQKTHIKALTQKFFTDMLSLEIEMATRKFTFSTIECLVQLYAKAIEYYDSLQDPIVLYFQEKIQITLASQKALKVILKKQMNNTIPDVYNDNNSNTNTTTTTNNNNNDIRQAEQKQNNVNNNNNLKYYLKRLNTESLQTDENDSADDKGYNVWSSGISDTNDDRINNNNNPDEYANLLEPEKPISNYNIKKLRIERAKGVDRYIKVQNQKFSTIKSIATILEEYATSSMTKDILVRKNIDQQHDYFKAKLDKRRLMSISKNPDLLTKLNEKSMTIFDSDTKTNISNNLERLLDDLDITDEASFLKTAFNPKFTLKLSPKHELSLDAVFSKLSTQKGSFLDYIKQPSPIHSKTIDDASFNSSNIDLVRCNEITQESSMGKGISIDKDISQRLKEPIDQNDMNKDICVLIGQVKDDNAQGSNFINKHYYSQSIEVDDDIMKLKKKLLEKKKSTKKNLNQ